MMGFLPDLSRPYPAMPTNSVVLSHLLLVERKSLLRQVARLVGAECAEDVAQKIWLKIQGIRDDPPILDKKAYLRRLARNVALDHMQGNQRQALMVQRAEALLYGEEDELGTERIVESRETLERVHAAILALPCPNRRAPYCG